VRLVTHDSDYIEYVNTCDEEILIISGSVCGHERIEDQCLTLLSVVLPSSGGFIHFRNLDKPSLHDRPECR